MIKFKRSLVYIFLIIVSVLSVFPLYWMVISSTNRSIDILRGTLLPGNYFLQNLQTLLSKNDVRDALLNSIRNSFCQTFLSVLVCSIAGYGFEVYHDKAKDIVMTILLLAMMVPFIAIMVPLFRIFSGWHLLNNIWGLLLPSMSSPFLIMMFRQAARSFPVDIIESSRLDGLSEIGIFFRMFIPTMKSTFGAAITVSFMGAWNNYMWPLIVFQKKEQITMPIMVSQIVGIYATDYGELMIGVLLCTIPTAAIFLLLQKSFENGITGSVKG